MNDPAVFAQVAFPLLQLWVFSEHSLMSEIRSTYRIAVIVFAYVEAECGSRMWKGWGREDNIKLGNNSRTWERRIFIQKKNAEKTVTTVIHCQLKKMIQVKLKLGLATACVDHGERNQINTSRLILTELESLVKKEIAFGAGSCVSFTCWNGKKTCTD